MHKLFYSFLLISLLTGLYMYLSKEIDVQSPTTSISSYQDSLALDENNSISFVLPSEWNKLNTSNDHCINLINTTLSSTLTITTSSKVGIYDPSIHQYLENLTNIYQNDSVIKIIDSGIIPTTIEDKFYNNIGYTHKNIYNDSSFINELEIHILLDNKVLLLRAQNLDGSSPNNLSDTLLQIITSMV